MIELYEHLTAAQANLCGLILTASGIPFRARKGVNGWSIRVGAHHYKASRRAITEYFKENRDARPLIEDPPAPAGQRSYAGIWIAAVLAVFYYAVACTGNVDKVWTVFGASANRIMDGEIYRTVTALMLHADLAHLAGNMAGTAVFVSAVCYITGWGVGTLMVLMSGILGNFVNAAMYQSGHLSIGASTAIFGAVGILSGYQFLRKRRFKEKRFSAWVPLLGGLALLGMLGTGAHVDLMAHFFGFCAGIVLGAMYAFRFYRIPAAGVQAVCLAIAVFLVALSWGIGFGYYG